MKKFWVIICGVFMATAAFCAGENIPTSKSYVDTELAPKQDKIAAAGGAPQVLMNTGTAGEVGVKNIYDSTGSYATQTNAVIDAVTMNTTVQNAIDSEFQCVEYNPNDPTDCWLMDIKKTTNILQQPTLLTNSTFDSATATLSNTWTIDKDYVDLYLWYADNASYGSSNKTTITRQNRFIQGQIYKNTFTTEPTTRYLYIKHNDREKDIGAYFKIEPSTTYTVIVKATETNLSVIGGMKLQLMLVRGNYEYDDILPYGENIYIPQGN